MYKLEVKGYKEMQEKLKKISDTAPEEVDKVLAHTAAYAHETMVDRIRIGTQTGTGHLVQSAYWASGAGFSEIGNRAEYAPYVEFGTGKHVKVPPEFQALANMAKSAPTDKGKAVLQKFKDWCRRLGIDEKYAWPIMMSVLREGLTARPFLFPAFQMGKMKMIELGNKMLTKLMKGK